MASEKLKVGIIGGGSISNLHLNSFNSNQDVCIAGICDLNLERAEQAAAQYGAAFHCGDYKELLDRKDIDAVVICTWNNTHAEIAIAALEAGKHVFVEKPLSTTLKDALKIESAVKRTDKILQVGFVRRFDPNVQILKKFIDAGELGQIYYGKASSIRRLGNPGGWFADQEKSGGGPLIDIGIHALDTCWYLMGKPKAVTVSGNTFAPLGNRSHITNLSFYKAADYQYQQNTVEDLALAMIRFENGASLMLDTSFTLHAKANETYMKIYGENGGAELEPELWIVTERHNTILNIRPQSDHRGLDIKKAFQNQIDHFVSCCLQQEDPLCSVSDGVEMIRMISAIYESAQSGKEVKL
jgi:predicted dehydrogenase